MTWMWRLEDAEGAQLSEPSSPGHPTQADAETWLGEAWRELADAGVAQVSLLEGDRLEYGPMALSAG